MNRSPLNPHDRLFRFAFSEPDVARDFVAHYLPAEISQELDIDTLTPVDGTFIDEVLDKHVSDALFRVQLRNHGGEGLIYVLVEHKSYPDRMTARQVLRYIERIWTQEERKNPRQGGLIPILPVVFYHGASDWTVALDLVDLIDAPEAFLPYMPRMRYLLWDLNQTNTQHLVGSVQLRLAIRLMELFQADDLPDRMPEIVELLNELTEPKTVLEWVKVGLYYLSASARVGREDVVEMARRLLPAGEEGEEIMSAIAEVWFQDGLEQGREEGLEKGLEKGVRKTIGEIIQIRFGEKPETLDELLATYDHERLNEVLATAVEAEDLDDFLANILPQA